MRKPYTAVYKYVALTLFLVLSACGMLKKAGMNATDGVFESLQTNQYLIDSLATRLSKQIVTSAVEGVEQLDVTTFEKDINLVFRNAIDQGLLDETNRQTMIDLVDALLLRIDERLVATANKLPQSLVNDELLVRVEELRTTLLGEQAQKEITALVESALQPTESFRGDLKEDVKELIDYAKKSSKEGASNIVWMLIGGAVLIVGLLGFVIYQIQKKLNRYKRGLLATTIKIDRLDRKNYERTKLRPEDFESSPETYKTVHDLIKKNEVLFENKRKFKDYHRLGLKHLLSFFDKNCDSSKMNHFMGEIEGELGSEVAEFVQEELDRIRNST